MQTQAIDDPALDDDVTAHRERAKDLLNEIARQTKQALTEQGIDTSVFFLIRTLATPSSRSGLPSIQTMPSGVEVSEVVSGVVRLLVNAECFWQLSSSAGFAVGVLKAHPFSGSPRRTTTPICGHGSGITRRWSIGSPLQRGSTALHHRSDTHRWRRSSAGAVQAGDMARCRKSCCCRCRMWRIVGNVRTRTSDFQDRRGRLARRKHRRRPVAAWRWRWIGRIPSAIADVIHAILHPMSERWSAERREVHRGPTRRDRRCAEARWPRCHRLPWRAIPAADNRRRIPPDRNKAKSDATDEPDDPAPVKLPAGFGMTEGGLYYTDPARDDAKPEWLCQEFRVLGECENGMGGDWGVVLAWRDAAQHRQTWIVPRELVHGEPNVIAARLESQGLRCNFVKDSTGEFRRCLASARPDRRLTAVTCGGLAWHELRPAGWHCVRRRQPDPATRVGPRRSVLRQPRQRTGLAGSGGAIRSRQLAHRILPGGRVCRTAVGVHQRTERWSASVRAIPDREDHGCRLCCIGHWPVEARSINGDTRATDWKLWWPATRTTCSVG